MDKDNLLLYCTTCMKYAPSNVKTLKHTQLRCRECKNTKIIHHKLGQVLFFEQPEDGCLLVLVRD